MIVDHFPLRRISAGNAQAVKRFKQLESGNLQERLAIVVQLKGISGADEKYLKAKMGLPANQLAQIHEPSVIYLKKNPIVAMHID